MIDGQLPPDMPPPVSIYQLAVRAVLLGFVADLEASAEDPDPPVEPAAPGMPRRH
jgi:hypothetical protein